MNRDDRRPLARLARWSAAVLAAAATAIAGCGGGVGVGGTGGYASGPITGFGSIFVNGVEFGDDTALVEDEDGVASSSAALRLGMVVEVDSGPINGVSGAQTAAATRIRYGSEVVGPVDSVNPGAGTLVVFGQTVAVTASTVFDDSLSGGLPSLVLPANVEVFGFFDAAASGFVATRIELRTALPAFRLRAPVQAIDTSAHTLTTIGGRVFSYGSLALPAGLSVGGFVRVLVGTTPVGGQWTVLSFGDGARRLPDIDHAELRGTVTSIDSPTRFSVNGQPVNAAFVTLPAGFALGVSVEVEGASTGGVLRASSIVLDDNGGVEGDIRLKGTVGSTDTAHSTFVVQGVTVIYGPQPVQYDNGSAANIADGVQIEVRGVPAPDGTRVLATRIGFR
jgi:hypothetical protein